MGAELRKVHMWAREGFSEKVTSEVAFKTKKVPPWQGREAEGKCELSQGGRNPQCVCVGNGKGPLINARGKDIVPVSLTPRFRTSGFQVTLICV